MQGSARYRGRCASPPHGFTLVELLVVIGIIVVLLGLLLPSSARARFEARGLKCRNNIRQLALSLTSYASEWKQKFPPNISGPATPQYWFDDARIGCYLPPLPRGDVSTTSVWICPEDEGSRRSYSMNLWASSKVDQFYLAPPPRGELWGPGSKHASKLLLLVESWSYHSTTTRGGFVAQPTVGSRGDSGRRFGGGGGLPNFPAGRFGMVNCELTYSRHRLRSGPGTRTQPRGRIVIAFADGHVDLLASDALVNFNTGVLTGECFWFPSEVR